MSMAVDDALAFVALAIVVVFTAMLDWRWRSTDALIHSTHGDRMSGPRHTVKIDTVADPRSLAGFRGMARHISPPHALVQ